MHEAILYILTGLTLYAGGQHLYLAAGRREPGRPHWQLGGFYVLLAGFAAASALTYQSASLAVLLPTGKLEISLGIALWVALLWYVAQRTGFRPLIALDLITAVWVIFLVRNLMEPNSLQYADVTPVNQTTLSGQTLDLYYSRISPWWTALELTMLATLSFCAYASYRLYRSGSRRQAVLLFAGLGLLALVALHDHLVSAQVLAGGYLAPFGFLFFLLPASLWPLYQRWRQPGGAPQPSVVYNLPYLPEQASFHTDVSQLRAPFRPVAAAEAGARVTLVRREPAAGGGESAPAGQKPEPKTRADRGGPVQAPVTPAPRSAPMPEPERVQAVTDSLIDIAVFATMALNRFKRGDADPQTLESLCRKIRTQAIHTRRLTQALLPPESSGDGKDPKSSAD